jgi:hypothetical protein
VTCLNWRVHHRKLAGIKRFCMQSNIMRTYLIAGEGAHGEALVSILAVQLLQWVTTTGDVVAKQHDMRQRVYAR